MDIFLTKYLSKCLAKNCKSALIFLKNAFNSGTIFPDAKEMTRRENREDGAPKRQLGTTRASTTATAKCDFFEILRPFYYQNNEVI